MKVINNKEYYTTTEAFEYVKNNTRDNKTYSKHWFSQKIKNLHNVNDAVIYEKRFLRIEANYLKQTVELYNKSIKTADVALKLKEFYPEKTLESIISGVNRILDVYIIPLFYSNEYFIDIDVANETIEKIKELDKKFKENNYIKRNKLIEIIKLNYAFLDRDITVNRYIDNAINDLDLEIIPSFYKYNLITSAALFPEKSIAKVLEYISKNLYKDVDLINISYEEFLSLSREELENNYKEFTTDDAKLIHCNGKHTFESRELERTFSDTDVKVIKIKNQQRSYLVYVSKQEFNSLANLLKDYVLAAKSLKKFNVSFNSNVAKANKIETIKFKNLLYIKKTEIERYIAIDRYNKSLKDTISLHSRLKLKMDCFPHEKSSDYPNVKKLILDYSRYSDSKIGYAQTIFKLYELILDHIKVDLKPENIDVNNELFTDILKSYEGKDTAQNLALTPFMNYLRSEKNFELIGVFTPQKGKEELQPYTPEEFINLLSEMLKVIADDEKIKNLYRDWRLTSSFSYVLLHYCLAWRRTDLINNFPMIDLSIISEDICDGETFIKWLEDGNTLSYEQTRVICESLEKKTYHLRKKASKNDEYLCCIISDELMHEIATVLCINEANRQIFFTDETNRYRHNTKMDRCFMNDYLHPYNITKQFLKKLNINIVEILNSNFHNIRMNKGFMNLVRDKAEELNLFSYTCVQLIRSHKATDSQLSEATKIYLDKSVQKGALLAFSTGTMGSTLFLLKHLVDNNFDKKTLDEQIEDIKGLNVTPYDLEINIKSINKKIKTLNKELKMYFAGNGSVENFLEKLLYGQSFYGIEKRTKCLVKITRDDENALRISPFNPKEESTLNKCPLKRRSCIGCDYMIALRYFIYEFEKKYNQILTKYENAKSEIDLEIFEGIINDLYVPVLNDLAIVLGEDKVQEVIDLDRYMKFVE